MLLEALIGPAALGFDVDLRIVGEADGRAIAAVPLSLGPLALSLAPIRLLHLGG